MDENEKKNNLENKSNNNSNKIEVHYFCKKSNPPIYDSSDDELFGITKSSKKVTSKKKQNFKNEDIRQFIKIIRKNNKK